MRLPRLPALLSIFLLSALLSACGGGGGSESDVSIIVAGIVEDGPIVGATVTLRDRTTGEVMVICGPAGSGSCETRTDGSGRFSFTLPEGTPLAEVFVESTGGEDIETGVDFTGIAMRAPLALFSEDEGLVAVTPVTSLVAGGLESGLNLDEALSRLGYWLGLGLDIPPSARPSTDRELLKRSLLLSKLALELKEQGEADPFETISSHMGTGYLLDAQGDVDPVSLEIFDIAEEARQEVAGLNVALNVDDGLAPSYIFRKEEITGILMETIRAMLADDLETAPLDEETLENVKKRASILTTEILEAAGEKVIPLGGPAPQRIARYVLFSYGLTSLSSFDVPPETFVAGLVLEEAGDKVELKKDPHIPELAALQTLYSVAEPLLDFERPGNDNGKRIDYYYDSDISHLFHAESLIGQVFDDTANDPVMVEVAGGMAAAGFLEEAETILKTQVYQSELRAEGYRKYAESLIDLGRYEDASRALEKAFPLYLRVIDASGEAGAGNSDIENLQNLAADYRRAQELEAANEVLDYLDSLAPQLTTYISYGRLITGTMSVADGYIDRGDIDAAIPLVDSMYGFAQDTPPNAYQEMEYYKLRVFYLIEAAERYATLGMEDEVLEIADMVERIRSDDGLENLTGKATWAYIPTLVEALYRVGATEPAFSLAESIPDSYLNERGQTRDGSSYQSTAFKLVATFEALYAGWDKALEIVNEHLPADEDKIEALTYFATNKHVEYIALAYISAGRFDLAKKALDKATELLGQLDEPTDKNRYVNLIQRGYVKVAELYREIGEEHLALDLLAGAEEVLGELTEAEYVVNGNVDIALGYELLGKSATTDAFLSAASLAAEAFEPALAAEKGAALYKPIIEAYLEIGDAEGAAAAVDRYVASTRDIFDESRSYGGNDHDRMAEKEVDNLFQASYYLVELGMQLEALQLLEEAREVADQIYVESTRVDKYVHDYKFNLVAAHANAGDIAGALEIAESLPYPADRYDAIQAIALVFAQWDDFPDTPVATIDTDGDGKPDFFNPLVSDEEIAASGLVLDEDSDGDGIPDVDDSRPLYAD